MEIFSHNTAFFEKKIFFNVVGKHNDVPNPFFDIILCLRWTGLRIAMKTSHLLKTQFCFVAFFEVARCKFRHSCYLKLFWKLFVYFLRETNLTTFAFQLLNPFFILNIHIQYSYFDAPASSELKLCWGLV